MFKYSREVCFSGYFYKVAGLLDVNTIETFDDAKVMKWIRHMHLEFRFYVQRSGAMFSADDEVIYLAENKDEFLCDRVAFVVETVLVGASFKVQAIEHDAMYMLVP